MRLARFLLVGVLAAGVVGAAETPEIPFEGTRPAPEFPEGIEWLNTDRSLSIAGLKGKIVLLDFWTYCCINCMHVIPDLKKLEAKYANELVVIGVHSAKFDNEKQTRNIREAILRYEIEHPVINDKDFVVWRSYSARAWPTLVLINPNGKVIGYLSGEGIYEPFDRIIGATIRHFDAKGEIDRAPVSFALEKANVPRSLLSYPGKIVADPKTKRLFFSDSNNNRLVVAQADGTVLEVIGEGVAGLRDGDFSSARLFRPQGVAFDPDRELLYVADTENHAIRKVDLKKREVTTVVGTGRQGRRRSGGGERELNSPWDLVLIGEVLYVAMAGPHQLWTVDTRSGAAEVHAGSGRENLVDGPLSTAALAQPSGIVTDGVKLYFADSEVSAIRTADLKPEGRVDTLIGKGLFEFGDVDGKYPEARLQHCIGLGLHGRAIYVADTYNHKIRRFDLETGELESFIGTGKPGSKDGLREEASLNEPNGLCFIGDTLFIADSNNHLIRACDLGTGEVRTLALKGLDKLGKSMPSLDLTDQVLEPLKIAPGADSLQVEIVLPEGTKLNPLGPSKLGAVSGDAEVLALGSFDGRLTRTSLTIPLESKVGRTTLKLDGEVYYCSSANEGLCYIKLVRGRVPIEVEENGSGAPRLVYRVE